ncbi:MAG TPA: AAA family ATPase [Bacteroidales bacterium]|nr:AAA family ATPase [Bacteroidales bacterium]
MMKLAAFRIKNFRSIVDTGWQNISPDNITCLIGQNESGKTSVLEGLKAFYTGVITEDVLRSDLTLPEISCRFSIPPGWLAEITENPGTELKELLGGLDHVELTRTWIPDLSSYVAASGEISQYLDSLEDAWRIYLDDVDAKLEGEMKIIREQEAALEEISAEENEIKERLPADLMKKSGFRLFGRKPSNEENNADINITELKNRLNELKKLKTGPEEELRKKAAIRGAGEELERLKQNHEYLNGHLNELSVKLEERHQKMTLLMRPIEDDDDDEWRKVLADYKKTRTDLGLRKTDIDAQVAFAGYIMDGSTAQEARGKVDKEIQSYKSQVNSNVLGKKYFDYCPVFEMFEDFGSLLPNRIDLEDIIKGNEDVEGFKAARNFLTLAHLDYSFFQQQSSRILKQKIENLNRSLTGNFHDFWQQSIGRNNKIQIQFELDHYSSSFGEKAGKPYLEFWIKDEGERLYPKQRSRGVRWFLSFYMELKASANISDRQMVLLVDEPGVSLHARAQEDVLKVFEDIKDRIQVIYTTHSPHLVEINKLHRVLAVQRDDMDNMRSTTRILDPLSLSAASPDTLTPLQSILGNPMAGEGFSAGRVNMVVNNTGSFYVINAIIQLMGYKGKVCVIPSTNVSSIPLLCNILMGWGMDFAVLLFENDEEKKISDLLEKTVFTTDKRGKELIIRMPSGFQNAEDLLSTLDFKNHIINTREGITVSNSQYIKEKEIPRNFLLSRFLTEVKTGKITIRDFDEETIENFEMIISLLEGLK